MDITSTQGLLAILQIIIIDILLAGDNAIVIGMAAKNLPEHLRKRAIFWGTAGAIVLRLVMAILFIEALDNIPALRIVGGIMLLWIGYSLLKDGDNEHNIEAKDNIWGAIATIIIADGVMGIDNVLGVVAAAEGHFGLVVAGMLVTVPIIVWGSTIFVKLIDKFPVILYAGGGILGWVSASMIQHDPMAAPYIEPYSLPFHVGCVVLVLGAAI
ncbi:TerC family protein, partial [Veillonella sp. oral taxon 780]